MDSYSTGDVDSEHGLHLPSHSHQYNTPQSANGAPFATTFRHMDHSIDSGASRAMHPSASPHLLAHDGNGNLHQGHVQQNYYSDSRNAMATPSTPSQSASPRFAALSPGQNRQMYQAYVPQDRSLPDREANDENIDDAYIAFVLYCNPSFPTSIDTTELRKVFRTPPKSDGKSFSTYTLYGLIRRFDSKEIKTWTELALELGVEKPAVEKGQSSQKVQQYSVRLKRWMRALHIDAFFEYLMGKTHTYYNQIPPLSEPFPESRDGVPIEEDLAVRALDPKFRPKRGRRRADDHDDDMEPSSAIDNKRPHLDTSFSNHNGYPSSAIPMTAHPDDLDRFVHGDPWSAAITPASSISGRGLTSNQQLRWRNETPSTPHPLSAIGPMSAHPDGVFDEPQSAVTPTSRSRPRRRHGPAVSSAWPSTNTTANGKLRGRPPSNRSVRDGPFVTFPANPKTKEGPTIDLSRNHITTSADPGTSTPATSESPNPQFRVPQQPTPISTSSPHQRPLVTAPQSRPERLQLQVPQHVGNPVVRLVTPTLLVNGQMNEAGSQSAVSQTLTTPGLSTASTAHTTASSFFGPPAEGSAVTEMDEHSDGPTPGFRPTAKSAPLVHHLARNGGMMQSPAFSASPFFSNEDLKRALAADLLRAEIEGRGKRLRGSEAKELAEALLSRLRPQQHSAISDPGGISGLSSEDVFRLTCASWLGLNLQLGLSSSGVQSTGAGKRITVRRFRVGGDGYDSPLDEDDSVDAGDEIRETFDISWALALGDCAGRFSFKGLILGQTRDAGWDGSDDIMDAGSASDQGPEQWKEKYSNMEKKIKEQEEEIRRLRDRVLEAIL